jgi:hypothetical protein
MCVNAALGIAVRVELAPGWPCGRCRKVLPDVGLDPDHPTACLRCVEVMTGDRPDLHLLAASRFDRFLAEERAAGFGLAEAVRRAGHRNHGRDADGTVPLRKRRVAHIAVPLD